MSWVPPTQGQVGGESHLSHVKNKRKHTLQNMKMLYGHFYNELFT